ncbi:B3 domain-containing protein [Prunus yedoensis var. nudiflora]|uniref:B3 domain-containing protein n=1 Tax=Prunus yedoensis var. nudiflora TaxID=2094558 RepID=A0A314URY9_PRUYE|nr:B3 domain-containing protein [Prunus yedoensis var. nudiflora]
MGSRICMNVLCGTTNTHEWKKGWPLRSGGFAHLCFKCGAAYEKLVYCDKFHAGETGWRDCSLCRKPLHCGCIVSKSLYECLDYGGVGCISCAKSSQPRVIQNDDVLNGFGGLKISNYSDRQSTVVQNGAFSNTVDEGKLLQLCKIMEANESNLLPQPQRGDINVSLVQKKQEEVINHNGEVGLGFSSTTQPSIGSLTFSKSDNGRTMIEDMNKSSSQPSLSMTLGSPSATPSFVLPFPGGLVDGREQSKTPSSFQQGHGREQSMTPSFQQGLVDGREQSKTPLSFQQGLVDGREQSKTPSSFQQGLVDGREQSKTPSSFQQGQKSRPILPKPLKPAVTMSSETNKGGFPNVRVARPPAEGRGKNQLLPRYWPRITDQELQKLSGDLNSTIVPLFEKVLSASDAGRIGRLVLPKACAEAYFPPISQSEGLPIRIQDVKGNEWMFQFRFWPNNNSRMYVLEGVTPCIQSMQLQAGDTVTFSRIDPGGRLVMGFRKASKSLDMQDPQTSMLPNGSTPGETSCPSVVENPATGSGHLGLFQTNTGSKDPHLHALSEHLHLTDGDMSLHKNDYHGHRTSEDLLQQPVSNSDKKRARNIGPKSKRLLMHSEDVLELRLTWEEAQDLLRPPPSVKPSIVTIEDHEFEEYDEPPVFGKRSLFTASSSERQEQWAQCDDCSKWRRLPADVLLPPKWTCSENSWDTSRRSCSAPEEMSQKDLDSLLRASKDLKKRRIIENCTEAQEHEPSGLDALASAAILGDNVVDSGEQSVGATTRHPRHRPGCTCIVCIQPPSGKGKHKPTCTCNVCLTVRRRFKTLMMRKKKRQSEREAENAQKDNNNHKDESEINGTSTEVGLHMNHSSENGGCQSRIEADVAESSSAGQIDLNCEPNPYVQASGLTLLRLADAASQPLNNYMKESCLTNMMCEPQAGIGSSLLTQATDESERRLSAVAPWDCEGRGDAD